MKIKQTMRRLLDFKVSLGSILTECDLERLKRLLTKVVLSPCSRGIKNKLQ